MEQNKPLVIAFLGRAGSGKTTAGKYLVDEFGFEKKSFAEPLKKLAKHLLDFTDEQLYGSQEAKEAVDLRYGFSSASFLQKLGDGARVCVGESIWLTGCLNNILKSEGSKFVIDDARYVNECERIAKDPRINGFVVKLVCPDAKSNRDPNHPSEAEVDCVSSDIISATIESYKSPDSVDLKNKVKMALERLGTCYFSQS